MAQRDFYLAAYDVTHPRRLAAALALVRGYTTGGQKSVHEVFLTRCHRPAHWSQLMIGTMEPPCDRHIGATP